MQADFLEREPGTVAPAAPLRKAAMLLHSMSEVDRRWMLARIDRAQRTRLEGLLDELTALEFPVDADLVRESLKAGTASTVAPTPRATDMSGWTAEQAAGVLLAEPDDLIALVLRAGDWPWAAALRARLGATRVRAIEASRYSAAAGVPAGLTEATLRAVGTRFMTLNEPASRHRPSTAFAMPGGAR